MLRLIACATLQRSPGTSAGESNRNEVSLLGLVGASTEPRHFGRGEDMAAALGPRGDHASTEPRHFGRGESVYPKEGTLSAGASTEPRHFGRGEQGNQGDDGRRQAASTEPRHLGRGETTSPCPRHWRGRSFNGAPALRPGRAIVSPTIERPVPKLQRSPGT